MSSLVFALLLLLFIAALVLRFVLPPRARGILALLQAGACFVVAILDRDSRFAFIFLTFFLLDEALEKLEVYPWRRAS